MFRSTEGKSLLEKSYYTITILMFLLTGLLAFFYIRLDIHQEQIRIVRGMESDIRDLLIRHIMDRIDEPDSVDEHILGFGIYDANGDSILRIRQAPETFLPGEGDDVLWNRKEQWVEYTEQTDILLDERPPWIGNNIREEMLRLSYAESDNIIYMRISLPEGSWNSAILRSILLLALVAALGFGTLFLRFSNLRYRRIRDELASKEHLIVLGTAARTLTHEIKNPLSAIRLQTNLLRRIAPEGRSETDIIDGEVDRLALLMDQTRSFLDDPAGSPQILNLTGILIGEIGRYPDAVRWELSDSPVPVKMDPDRLRSVIDNMMSNALESGADPDGVSVELSAGEGRTVMAFRDRGDGIPEATMERVRDPFFTTKSRGTGLGLYLASRFIKAAGGEMNIESICGEGTTVLVTLPEAS